MGIAPSRTAVLTKYTDGLLRDYLQWDIATWKQALAHWDDALATRETSQLRALELGARDGGLSLYLAHKGMQVICSDIGSPTELAHQLHKRHGVSDQVLYQDINATDIPYDEKTFDVVIFKSILGGVGTHLGYGAIQKAVSEMHRVLTVGGLLLFAENSKGSLFHRKARSWFVRWGNTWYYPTLDEIAELTSLFSASTIKTYGFFSCVKKDFAPFVLADKIVCRSQSSHRHYMAFGHACK